MTLRTGLVHLSLDLQTFDGPPVEGQGTPVTQIARIREAEMDPATAAALLRAQADRLDPKPEPTGVHPHPGHKPGCRCIETSVTGRTADVGGHPRPSLPGAMPTARSARGEDHTLVSTHEADTPMHFGPRPSTAPGTIGSDQHHVG